MLAAFHLLQNFSDSPFGLTSPVHLSPNYGGRVAENGVGPSRSCATQTGLNSIAHIPRKIKGIFSMEFY